MGQVLPAGVLPSAGQAIHPGVGDSVDSVDEDDGVIDGSGLEGHSFFEPSGPSGITFKFDLEVFDAEGNSLGGVGTVVIADESYSGTTAEDHFFGTRHDAGISAIKIKN